MAQLRATGPYVWVTWLPRLLSGESSCEWASWFKAQHEGSSWARAPSGFGQAGWLMDHTALLNERRELWEKQGYSVLTGAQNGCILRGSGAALAGKPDLAARRRDGVTVIGAKTGRPSPRHAVQAMIGRYALPRAVERRQGLRRSGQGASPATWRTSRRRRWTRVSPGTRAASSAGWRPGCRPGACPAPWSAGSARSPRRTARTGWRRARPRRELPAASSMNPAGGAESDGNLEPDPSPGQGHEEQGGPRHEGRQRHPERPHRQGRPGRRPAGHDPGGHIPAVSLETVSFPSL